MPMNDSRRGQAQEIERYIRSYAEFPETDDEVAASDAFLRAAWMHDDDDGVAEAARHGGRQLDRKCVARDQHDVRARGAR